MTQAPAADAAGERSARPAPLWTRAFVLLCLVNGLCYVSNQLVAVLLPLFVEDLGGSPVFAGLAITAFSVTSFILRPLIGHLTDTWSVRGTLFGGGAILGWFALALVVPSLWVTFIANAVRGVGWGAFNTGASVGVALTAPPTRRAEASGYYAVVTTAAAAFAPALALWLLSATGQFPAVFAVAGAAGLVAAGATGLMPRIGSGAKTFWRALALPREELRLWSFIERRVLLASLLLVCVTMTAPATHVFVPVHARAIGVDNIAVYFIVSGAMSILVRVLFGRFFDQGSRGLWILAGYGLMIVSFPVFILADSIALFVLAGVLNTLGHVVGHPALTAFVMDRAEPGRMGRAMATFSMAYRVGEGLGAPMAGVLILAFGYSGMYAGAMAFAVLGVLLTLRNWATVGRPVGHHATA